MRHLFIMPFVLLVAVFSGYGEVPEVSITPTNLDQHGYTFAISTNATQDGMAFHVVIISKTHDIPTNSSVNLQQEENWGELRQEGRAAPPVKVSLKKNKRVWEADFSVPSQQLLNPGLSCLFAEGYDGESGGMIDAKTVTYYYIRIQEFAGLRLAEGQVQIITWKDLLALGLAETNSVPGVYTNKITRYHYYYMGTGTKDGYDYVAKMWGNLNSDGARMDLFRIRQGELQIEKRHRVVNGGWEEIDLSKQ